MKKIGHYGVFDHDSYGDLLFPHLIEKQYPEYNFVHISPTNIRTRWEDAKPIMSVEEASKIDDFSAIIVGGGDIIGSGNFYSKKWGENLKCPFGATTSVWIGASNLAAKLNIKLAWNAPGVPNKFDQQLIQNIQSTIESTDYLSVRDSHSKDQLLPYTSKAINVIPDTAILVNELWPVFQHNKYLVISISKGDLFHKSNEIKRLLKKIKESKFSDFEIYYVPLMAWEYEDDQYKSKIDDLGINSSLIGASIRLQDVAELIGGSSGYIGNSLHGLITGISYNVPSVLVLPAFGNKNSKYSGFLNAVNLPIESHIARKWELSLNLLKHSNNLIPNFRNKVSRHYDKIKEIIEERVCCKKTIWASIEQEACIQAKSLCFMGLTPDYLSFLSKKKFPRKRKTSTISQLLLRSAPLGPWGLSSNANKTRIEFHSWRRKLKKCQKL